MDVQTYFRDRRASLVQAAVAAVLCTVATAFVVWALSDPQALVRFVEDALAVRYHPSTLLPIFLIAAPVLLGVAIYHGRRALDRRPLLTLSGEGLFYRDWRCGVVPWSEVEDCVVVVHLRDKVLGWQPRDHYLELHLRHPETYLERVHGRAEFSDDYQRSYFRIPMRNIRAQREELREAIKDWAVGGGGVLAGVGAVPTPAG